MKKVRVIKEMPFAKIGEVFDIDEVCGDEFCDISNYRIHDKEIKEWIDKGVSADRCTKRELSTIVDGWLPGVVPGPMEPGPTLFPSDWRIIEVLSEHLPRLNSFAQSYQNRETLTERAQKTTDYQEVLGLDGPNKDWYNIWRFVKIISSVGLTKNNIC